MQSNNANANINEVIAAGVGSGGKDDGIFALLVKNNTLLKTYNVQLGDGNKPGSVVCCFSCKYFVLDDSRVFIFSFFLVFCERLFYICILYFVFLLGVIFVQDIKYQD